MLSRFADPDDPGRIDIRLARDADRVPAEVLAAYGLEEATVTPLDTGSFNIHFRVSHSSGEFDLRKSNRPSDPDNLAYEAEALRHLRGHGFDLCPRLIPTADGRSNFWLDTYGWTLFEWVPGDGVDRWQPPNPERIRVAANVLADLHRAGKGFSPTARRGDWAIFAKPEGWPARWMERLRELVRLLGDEGADLLPVAEQVADDMGGVDFSRLPGYLCHGDYRPRNLRFAGRGGNSIYMVFDFDTSMISTRLLDLGGAATRFSVLGGNPQAEVEPGARFLTTYNETLPLTEYEWNVLPLFIRWRLIRDLTAYYDRWWLKIRDACTDLFNGAADDMVARARG